MSFEGPRPHTRCSQWLWDALQMVLADLINILGRVRSATWCSLARFWYCAAPRNGSDQIQRQVRMKLFWRRIVNNWLVSTELYHLYTRWQPTHLSRAPKLHTIASLRFACPTIYKIIGGWMQFTSKQKVFRSLSPLIYSHKNSSRRTISRVLLGMWDYSRTWPIYCKTRN